MLPSLTALSRTRLRAFRELSPPTLVDELEPNSSLVLTSTPSPTMPATEIELPELTTPAAALDHSPRRPSLLTFDSSKSFDSRPPSLAALPELARSYSAADSGFRTTSHDRRTLRRLSMGAEEDGDGERILAPVDKGVGAWSFVVFAWFLEYVPDLSQCLST